MDSKSRIECKIRKYVRKTAANKFVALLLLTCGLLSRMVSGESTALIFIMALAVPLFFSKKKYIIL